MKFKTLLLTVLGTIILVCFSLLSISPYIENSLMNNVHHSQSGNHNPVTQMTVQQIHYSEEQQFLQTVKSWSKENNYTILRREFDQNTKTSKFYVSANKQYYEKLLINHPNLNAESSFSSKSVENQLIVGLMNSTVIYPLDHLAGDSVVNNVYFISATLENVQTLQQTLNSAFPDAEIDFFQSEGNAFVAYRVLNQLNVLTLFISINLLLFVFINKMILSNMKKISLYKTEGLSNFKLWLNYSVKSFAWYNAGMIILGILCSMYFVPIFAQNAFVYYGNFLQIILANFVFSLFFSSINYVLIHLISPVNSIKGLNLLPKFIKYLNLSKLIIIVLSMAYVLPNTTYLLQNMRSLSQESKKIQEYNNLFVIDAIYGKYGEYHMQNMLGKENNLIKKLQANNKLFALSKYYPDGSQDTFMYLADKQYLVNQNLWESKYENKRVLFTQQQPSQQQKQQYHYVIRTEIDQLSNLDESLSNVKQTYVAEAYLDKRAQIIYMGDTMLTPLNALFYFDGTLDEAQTYMNQLLIEEGFEPVYLVGSLKESYYFEKNEYIMNGLLNLMVGTILILLYANVSMTNYKTYLASKAKKLSYQWVEGYSKFELFEAFFIENSLLLVSVIILTLLFFKSNVFNLILIVSFLFFVEFIIFLIFIAEIQFSQLRRLS